MSRKTSKSFVCSQCGHSQFSWAGKCPSCGAWNSLIEEVSVETKHTTKQRGQALTPQAVSDIDHSSYKKRLMSGDKGFDTVLGGGFMPGSIVLLAGQPGIGKSTLLLQIANTTSKSQKVLYVSGEESVEQVGSRAERIKSSDSNLLLASSIVADDIAETIVTGGYGLVVVDSIQTIQCRDVPSAAGTVSQITNATAMLTHAAKQTNTALLIVGHVTKEGSIAGPKILEHAVDVVLQLEGDRYGGFKILRTIKNRFGSTNEASIYEMKEEGLIIVDNPSAALLEERRVTDGSIVLATIEGSRPLLVEIQALVQTSSYGYPKRAASGFDLNRMNLLIAMLEKRTKLNLSDKDIYVNIVGGIHVSEPAGDLAVAMAIASASRGMQLKKNAVVFGELGLSGEIRHVVFADKRIAEAKKLGFEGAIGPIMKKGHKDTFMTGVSDIRTALNTFLEKD